MSSYSKEAQDGQAQSKAELESLGEHHPAPTIVIGLGNPILGDDGIGWKVAERIQEFLADRPGYAHVNVECLSLGGLSLMEHLVGYKRAILIDALNLNPAEPGSLHCYELNELPDLSAGHLTSTHDTSLQTALDVGRAMGLVLPAEIQVLGIESIRLYDFSEELTPAVSAAIPEAVNIVLSLIENGEKSPIQEELIS